MDDLYNNAWGDTSDFYTDTQSHASSSQSTWASPALASTVQHEEADLAAPSWSTGTDIKWNEPSDHEQSHGFTWSGADPDLAWGTSTYEDIALKKPETPTITEGPHVEEEHVEDEGADMKSDTAESVTTVPPTFNPPAIDDLRASSPEPPDAESPPSSPDQDGFGTFEDAITFEDTSLTSEVSEGLEEEPWGSPWAGTPAAGEEDDQQPVDEWEVARRNKERLDRLVPPELLANIISQCEAYFEVTASKPSPTHDTKVKEGSKRESEEEAAEQAEEQPQAKPKEELKEESWMGDWRSGIEGIEGLETLMQSLVPELILQPAPQFTKTAIVKNMASTVRLSKHLPLSKASPLSHYMAARGSTAWETAVKQSKDVVEEDVVPVGWRIVEKQAQLEYEPPTISRTSSGFFSFWQKRQSKTPASMASPKEVSPSRGSISSLPGRDTGTQSPRTSVDSSHTRTVSSEKDRHPSPAPSPTLVAPPEESSKASSTDLVPTPSPTHSTSSYADAPDLPADAEAQVPQHPPPSAVSRFLNRFSRSRSSVGSSSPRSSLALSTDDLEFLSDIIPSAADGHEDEGDSFNSLNSILKPEPLPPALPPPPLAPPPRPASVAALPAQLINTAPSVSSALVDPDVTSSLPPQVRTDHDDLEDVFGEFETSPTSVTASGIDHSAALIPVAATATRAQTPVISVTQTRTSSPSPFSFTSTLVPTRSESQPIVLPPPTSRPAPSVSVTSTIAPPPVQRAGTEPALDEMTRRQQLRPIAPLSFDFPSPSEPVSPALPSASEVPLAQLYPEAAARQHAKQSSISSSSAASTNRSMPSILPPPPPSQPSRSHTPIMVRAPKNSGVVPPLLAPPPGSTRPPAALTMNLLGGDDDDDFGDFSDFQSSAPATATTSPHQNTQKSAFTFPPPPASTTTKPTTLPPLLPPPSFGSSQLISSPSTPQSLSSDSLHDDFGARLLSTSTSLDSHRGRASGLNISFQSDQSLLTPHKEPSGFDFAASSSSALRTPSPPRPISKSHRPPLTLEPPKNPHPHSILSPEEKVSQHQRTLSLMERAAARPGQWPAPPSPLPQAISFPISGIPAPKQNVDLLGDDDFGSFESDAPPLPAPSATNGQKAVEPAQVWSSFAPVPPKVQEKAKPNGGSVSKTSGGGLSAQDLSFFEGL